MSMRKRVRSIKVALVLATMGAGCPGQQPVVCADCFEDGFLVKLGVGPSGTTPSPAVLYSGFRNGRCQEDVLCTGTPDAYLGDVEPGIRDWTKSCGPESPELIVFAGGHAPTLGTVDPTLPDVSVTPGPARVLHVTAWYVPGVDVAHVQFQLDEAKRIYSELGTGIDVQYQTKPFPAAALVDIPSVADLSDLPNDASCIHQELLVGPASAAKNAADPLFDPTQVNIYYVWGLLAGYRARSCIQDPSLPYVAFVDIDRMSSVSVTAHELGHILGHQTQVALPSGSSGFLPGDVDEIELYRYLPSDNLMQSAATEAKQVTIGQIYRMHFDSRSWLRLGEPVPAPGGYPRLCQSSPVLGGPCPPLTLQPPRGWP